ncbi:MAG: electron transfer flavoprotein subunit beta/FixA family protein [Rhodothermales bacterium]|nr:electron transfer flavoprotein subunit beta/FixA family protein [Rhodothermales bacterium]
MKLAVCVKATPDTTTKVAIGADGKSIQEDGIQWIISPYDEFAIEEAVKLSETKGGEVTVVVMGPPSVEKTIREALAMGAHKAIRVHCDAVPSDPAVIAKALADVLGPMGFDIIFTGRQAIDADHGQVPSRLAQILGLPCATVVVKLEIDGTRATALREVEGGHEKLRFSLPAVVGANRHLNEPRYRSLRGIMQAKRVAIDVVTPALQAPALVIEKMALPPQKSGSKLFKNGAADAAEVVRLLHEEAKVI